MISSDHKQIDRKNKKWSGREKKYAALGTQFLLFSSSLSDLVVCAISLYKLKPQNNCTQMRTVGMVFDTRHLTE